MTSNQRKKLPKNEAINAPKTGLTYVHVIKKAKETVPKLEELGIEVVGTRRTATGDLLLEVGSKKEAELFAIKLEEKLGNEMVVRRPTKTAPALISELEESTTTEELRAELVKRDLELANIKLFSIRTASNGWRTAKIEISLVSALRLAADPKIMVGWSNCRIKLLGKEKKVCFRYLETGYVAAGCQQEDRSNCCLKCKKDEYVAKNCKKRTGGMSTQKK